MRLSCFFKCPSESLDDVCSSLVFKFVESEQISKIWETLMQVWIAGYHGFLREAFRLFVERSDDAELYFLCRATNCLFSS